MDTSYTFPRTAPLPPDRDNEPTGSKQRGSNVLRASVLDAALQLGIGTSDSKVAKWMFSEGVEEEDEDIDTPALTSSAPSPNASEGSPYFHPHTQFSSPDSPYTPPIFPVRAPPGFNSLHVRRPSSDPSGYDKHVPELIPSAAPVKPRNKLTKKRADGYLSEGETLSKKRSNQDLSKAERKELEKARVRKEKEEKKEKKAAKKAMAAGYDTDGTEASAKRSRSREGGYETDDGYQSTGSKKSKSRFFRLGNKSKGEVNRAESSLENAVPPVPELPPIHPIADKFGLTLSFDKAEDRSITPTLNSATPSSDISMFSTGSTATLQASTVGSNMDLTPKKSNTLAPPHVSSTSISSSATSSSHATSGDHIASSSDEDTPSGTSRYPPRIRLPSQQSTPFIMRSPQPSPVPTPSPRLGSPMGKTGLPASPRPKDNATHLQPTGHRSPVPPSPQSFDPTHLHTNSQSTTTSADSRAASPAHLHPGFQHAVPPPTINLLASAEYIVPSPLPSPRGAIVAHHGLPPPSPPPRSPLPATPTDDTAVPRPMFTAAPGSARTRVRSQRYDRTVLPRRTVRSEEGHSTSPSAFTMSQVRRHQSATAAPIRTVSMESENDDDSLHSPVREVLSRYSRQPDTEETREWGQALARNESMKRASRQPQQQQQQSLCPPEPTLSDDESVYPDEDDAGDWDVSYYEESVDSHAYSQRSSSNHHYTTSSSEPSLDSHGHGYGRGIGHGRTTRSSVHHGVVPAGGSKPGWI